MNPLPLISHRLFVAALNEEGGPQAGRKPRPTAAPDRDAARTLLPPPEAELPSPGKPAAPWPPPAGLSLK
jgi:hypothetical protein